MSESLLGDRAPPECPSEERPGSEWDLASMQPPKFWQEMDRTKATEEREGVGFSPVNRMLLSRPGPSVSLSQTYETQRRGQGPSEGQIYLDRQKSCTPTSLQCTC